MEKNIENQSEIPTMHRRRKKEFDRRGCYFPYPLLREQKRKKKRETNKVKNEKFVIKIIGE